MRHGNKKKEKPQKVFRELTDSIDEEFRKFADIAAKHFAPRELEPSNVIRLCVRENHMQSLHDAWRLGRSRIDANSRETFMACFAAAPEHILASVNLKFSIPGDDPSMVLVPDYAHPDNYENIRPVDTAALEFSNKLQDDVEQWLSLCTRVSVAHAAFNWLNNMYRERTREQIRYVFPGIVPLLRRVAKNGNDDKTRDEALKWSRNLQGSLPAHNWSPPVEYREGLRAANEIVAMSALYDNKHFVVSDHHCGISLVQKHRVKLDVWPEPINLLGLDP